MALKSQVWWIYWNVDQSFCVNLKWHIWPAWTFEFFCLIFSPLAGLCATLFCFPSFYIIKPAPCNYGAGVCRVHLQRRKWPATPNWLDSCFIEVMDGEVCFVALGLHPPQVFDPPLENWPESHDLCHRQGLIVGLYLLQFSLFWLWIFVTMTGHRAAVLYEYCAALILCHRMIINVSSHLVSLSSTQPLSLVRPLEYFSDLHATPNQNSTSKVDDPTAAKPRYAKTFWQLVQLGATLILTFLHLMIFEIFALEYFNYTFL